MATTSDCKKFIVDFLAKNPQLVGAIFPNDPTAQITATNAKNWKRRYKCRPENSEYEFDQYTIYVDGMPINGWADGHHRVSINQFVAERGFYCDPFEDGLAFAVIEDASGKLYLADYIGD